MTYKFVIAGRYYGKNCFPALNDYIHACARSPYAGSKMKKDYQQIASNEIRKQLPRVKIYKPVRIIYKIYEASAKRDWSNCGSLATKFIEDSLQECGVLMNDNQKCVQGYSYEFDIDRDNPRIEVTIEEV